MPRHPDRDPTSGLLGGSVFSALASRISELTGEIYPLHVGDTWMEPGPAMDWRNLDGAADPRPHRYCDPSGIRPLLHRLVEKVRSANGIPVTGPGDVLVTTGATGALTATAMATVSPGDEVLLLAPYWPLIRGIVVAAGGVPVEVPLLASELDERSCVEALDAHRTSRTVALYISTPSNPTGKVLPGELLAAAADFARRNGLWILSDEVYEDYVYKGSHHSIGSMAPERTASVFSFSKAYGMAGYRCGYLAGPSELVTAARRIATHLWYSVATPSQLLAVSALEHGQNWIDEARESYRTTGDKAADRLGVPRPSGAQFLFLDVGPHLDDRGLQGFLEDCLADNLILAPGTSFGASYDRWVRLCFTCVPPDVVLRGVDRLARRLGPVRAKSE